MEYSIQQHFRIADGTIEVKVKIEETEIYVVYGRHVKGYYIAIPEIRIACEALDPESVQKNTRYLAQAGLRSDYAEPVCEAIKDIWSKIYG